MATTGLAHDNSPEESTQLIHFSKQKTAVVGFLVPIPGPMNSYAPPGTGSQSLTSKPRQCFGRQTVRNQCGFLLAALLLVVEGSPPSELNPGLRGDTFFVVKNRLHTFFFFFLFFFILRRMGKNRALAHHTSTYFHTRRVSI